MNKLWPVLFILLGLVVGVAGIIVLVKIITTHAISFSNLVRVALILVVSLILILFGLAAYSEKNRKSKTVMGQLIEDLTGVLSGF